MTMYTSRNEANFNNAKTYFSGVPCKNGHVAPRLAYCGRCVDCFADKKRDIQFKNTYGISLADRNELIRLQKNKCQICKRVFEGSGGESAAPCIDHCHESGDIRGILCGACNRMLGHANDDVQLLRNAIKYLERAKAILG